MSTSPPEGPPPSASPRACRLCDTPIPADRVRCPDCGLHVATDVPPETRWQLIGGMVIAYAVVAVLVLVTR